MKKYLLVGIIILIVVLLLLTLYFKPFDENQKISALVYDSTYGYRIEMERQQEGILFSYIPSAEHEPIAKLQGEECYDIVLALLKETGLSEKSAVSDNVSEKDADRLTIKYAGGKKRELIRQESDDTVRSIRSWSMEFSGFVREMQSVELQKEPE